MLLFPFVVARLRLSLQPGVQLVCHVAQVISGEAQALSLIRVVLGYSLVNLLKEHLYLIDQPLTVPFRGLAPYECVFVCLRLHLRAVDILHGKADESLPGKHYDKLGEHLVYLVLHPVAEAVDGVEVRLVVACRPYEVDVALQRALDCGMNRCCSCSRKGWT